MEFRKRSWKNVVWFFVFVLSVTSVSQAVIDKHPAPFRTDPEGQPPTTYQSWDFSVAADLESDTSYNSYGLADPAG